MSAALAIFVPVICPSHSGNGMIWNDFRNDSTCRIHDDSAFRILRRIDSRGVVFYLPSRAIDLLVVHSTCTAVYTMNGIHGEHY